MTVQEKAVQEIKLSMENKPGELSRIIAQLYDNDVNVTAFWVGTEKDATILRFVANDPDSAVSLLTGMSIDATKEEVIVAHIPSHPGGFNSLLKVLATAQIDILHTYPGLPTEDPVLVLHVDNLEKAVNALKDNWIQLQ